MYPIIFFDPILIETPHAQIYHRLGYRRGVTSMTNGQRLEVEQYISEALALIRLRGAGLRLIIARQEDACVALAGGAGTEVFESRRLARFLEGCEGALLMGATAGSEVVAAIEGDSTWDHLTRGVVFDAVASEMVDASLDWITSYFRRELRRENKTLTKKRYSAGYGDLILENQEVMFRLLELDRIGVEITDNFILIPEKSVTAIAGILPGDTIRIS